MEENMNYFNEENLDHIKFYFAERYDYRSYLSFDENSQNWILKPNSTTEKYDLLKMIKNHEELGEMLDFLPKDRIYDICFQIPELHEVDMYPWIEEGKCAIKIIAELGKNYDLLEPITNIDKNLCAVQDINSSKDFQRVLNNLETIGSGYYGIMIYDYKEQLVYIYEAPCSFHLKYIINETGNIIQKQMSAWEIIKMGYVKILEELYPKEAVFVTDIQNNIIVPVFNFLINVVDLNKKLDEQAIEVLKNAPEEVKKLINYATENRLNNAVNMWRAIINHNISFEDMNKMYTLIQSAMAFRA